MDIEIYEAISFLRNITSIGEFISADSILDQLKEHEGYFLLFTAECSIAETKPKEEAIKYFYDAVGTEIGAKTLVRLLIQWDEINLKIHGNITFTPKEYKS